MTFHLDLPYLNYILDIIEDIEKSINNISKDKFLKDKDIRDANIRRIEVIGKTVGNLSDSIKKKFTDVNWRKLSKTYEEISNQDYGIDINLIWEIINNDFPVFKEQILKIREDIKKVGIN